MSPVARQARDERDDVIQGLVDRLADEERRLVRVLDWLPTALSAGDRRRIGDGAAELARDVCDGTIGVFVAHDDGEDVMSVAPGEHWDVSPPVVREAPLLSAGFLADSVLRLDDVSRAVVGPTADLYGAVDGDRRLLSWLVAPVRRATGDRLGVLLVGHVRPHAFTARETQLLEATARHLSVALDNAALVDEYATVAHSLQETLLPPLLPTIDGLDVAARYRPAGDDSLIGGDFYDVFPSTGGNWVVAIGDVCGLGPEAAAVTGIARYTVRAVARQDPSPAPALAALNDAILSRAVETRFCTSVMLCVEPRQPDGRVHVRWSNAGHPPPLVLRDNGTVEVLDEFLGPLLGVLPDTTYNQSVVDLQPGDALVLYTDGVFEARRADGELFGEDRLAELVGSCAGRTADGIARRIELAVIDHLGALPDDDIAILVLRARYRP